MRVRGQTDPADTRMWHIGLALFAGGAAALMGLVGLAWLAWNALHRPRISRTSAISLHDAVGVLQLVFASVAGAGALVALIVAYRKQKVAEADSTHDRTRVFNERFTAIAAELGDREPAVRLAGVHAMAGLADDWPANRQTCVDVLCAYLRMPYQPVIAESPPEVVRQALSAAREIRETVIRVITAHMRATAAISWQSLNLDFTGVRFDGGEFRGAIFGGGKVSFNGSVFVNGTIDFRGAVIAAGKVDFSGAEFAGALVDFGDAEFRGGEVSFARARFTGGSVNFGGAVFSGSRVGFVGALLQAGDISFDGAVFAGGRVYLTRADFSGCDVDFTGVMFVGSSVEFMGATFSGGRVSFQNGLFSGGRTEFGYADFCGSSVDFSFANFSSAKSIASYGPGNSVNYGLTLLARFIKESPRTPRVSPPWLSKVMGEAELERFSASVLVSFSGAKFVAGSMLFTSAEFSGGRVDFAEAKFSGGQVDFSQVGDWSVPPLRLSIDDPPLGVRVPSINAQDAAEPIDTGGMDGE